MKFFGIRRIFSTENEGQYETIGAFWDELSAVYGRKNLRGLGVDWTENTIDYVIGLKEGHLAEENSCVVLPDDGWQTAKGRTEELGKLYDELYRESRLAYEIEMFDDDGNCEIQYIRVTN